MAFQYREKPADFTYYDREGNPHTVTATFSIKYDPANTTPPTLLDLIRDANLNIDPCGVMKDPFITAQLDPLLREFSTQQFRDTLDLTIFKTLPPDAKQSVDHLPELEQVS